MSKRVLIVDDDPDLIEANRIYLESQGFEVATAHSASEGLAVLERFQPDIVTADLMMEHHDSGFSFCRKVKARPETKAVPVILLTGVLRETGIELARRTPEERSWIQADEVVQKPITPRQLAEILGRHLAAQGGAAKETHT